MVLFVSNITLLTSRPDASEESETG